MKAKKQFDEEMSQVSYASERIDSDQSGQEKDAPR